MTDSCENLIKTHSTAVEELIKYIETYRQKLASESVYMYIMLETARSWHRNNEKNPVEMYELLNYMTEQIRESQKKLRHMTNELEAWIEQAEKLIKKIVACVDLRR